ncbi:MAG: tripartite tricarboxylate transporter permease [Betaproteobacteria bacterium]|nr:tripartite tricarboxylate transporter permease [Betaproteobacteria bacterium]
MLDLLLAGFGGALQPHNLLFLMLGVAVGILGGAMPGLSASTTLALLLPLTYGMPSDTSLILLAAAYVGAEYGGSISAIFINTPGTPGAIVTVLDGYQMTKRGYPVKALCASLVPGTVAGVLANVALITISVPLVEFALRFGAAEYFALGVFGLSIIASLASDDWRKGVLAAGIGLFLAVIGTDAIVGFPRFTFDLPELLDGIELVPALIGLLALSEAFMMAEDIGAAAHLSQKFSRAYPTWAEWKGMIPATLRGSVIGLVIGAIPGAGSTIAAIVAYNEEKRASKHPEKFGTGVLEGIAAPESANNAVVGGALIPMLTLGIPGSASAAIMISAIMLHGLQPGPELFSRNPEVVYNLFASQFFANLAMLALGMIGMTWWIKVVEIPKAVLAPCIIAICFIGTYVVNGNIWDVGVMVVLGIAGYALRKLDFPIAPIVLALVLGFMVETNFRRMLLISGGSLLEPLQRPITAILLVLAVLSFVLPILRRRRMQKISKEPGK